MKRNMRQAVFLICLVSGCAMGPHRFSRPRAESYVRRHPDLSGPVAERLLSGYLAVGMSKQEVRLCLGAPDHRDKVAGGGEPRDVWEYSEPAFKKGELESSKMWAREIPVARVVFGPDDKVVSYRYFVGQAGGEASARPPTATLDAAESRSPAAPGGVQRAEVPRHRAVALSLQRQEPRVNTIPAEWPGLTLNGVSVVEGLPYAMIDRRVVSPGEQIEGVTLLFVGANGVYLGMGESICFLAIGKTLRK